MLVLSRRIGESVRMSGGIVVTVIRAGEGKTRLAFEAPEEVTILRGELPGAQGLGGGAEKTKKGENEK